MNLDVVHILENWPPIASVSEAKVFGDESSLVLQYLTDGEQVAIIRFPLVSYFSFGSPNDEALNGHPLYSNGLQFYSVHKIENSSLVHQLEQRNSVHPRHDKDLFLEGVVHYIFTFQDSTLECITNEGFGRVPEIHRCNNLGEAKQLWRSISNA
jgi:hypothetical protein